MKKDDKVFEEIFKSIDLDLHPPIEIKQKIYAEIFSNGTNEYLPISILYSQFLEKTLKFSIPLSVLMSLFLRIQVS